MKSKDLLIVFVQNPELGKIKTNLTKTIGAERALAVYKKLLFKMSKIAVQSNTDKAVFYSEFIDDFDMWDDILFQKYVQMGKDMGEKMFNAFKLAFSKGYNRVCLISGEAYDLTTWTVEEAFFNLQSKDVVLGPTDEGNYYLIGMNSLREDFFANKKWDAEDVLLDTLIDITKTATTYQLLETLSSADQIEDFDELRKII